MTVLILCYVNSFSRIQYGKSLCQLFGGHFVFWQDGDHPHKLLS